MIHQISVRCLCTTMQKNLPIPRRFSAYGVPASAGPNHPPSSFWLRLRRAVFFPSFMVKSVVRDRLSKERRSWNMSRIRGKNTSPEMAVRRLLHRMGYRFRLHVRIPILPPPRPRPSSSKSLRVLRGISYRNRNPNPNPPALCASVVNSHSPLRAPRSALRVRSVCPDIVLPKYKTVIFVHGCFWHRHRGCKNCTTPTNRRQWWLAKLEGNAVDPRNA
jgi:DNA mismatch endonuclease Vsr